MCVSVCLLTHLTSGASVRPENTVTYSAGNGGQKICGHSLQHYYILFHNTECTTLQFSLYTVNNPTVHFFPSGSFFCLWVYNMPPTTTTSTHCSHWTLHFCVLVLFMVLSGYRCEDICFNDTDRSRCIMDLNDIVTENTDGDNCVRIEGTYSSHLYIVCTVNRV